MTESEDVERTRLVLMTNFRRDQIVSEQAFIKRYDFINEAFYCIRVCGTLYKIKLGHKLLILQSSGFFWIFINKFIRRFTG